MKVLFVHQNFPGQYAHLAGALADQPGNEVIAIGEKDNLGRLKHPRIREVGYTKPRGAGSSTHRYVKRFEAQIRVGQQVVRVAQALVRKGFAPDIICCHPSWGEGLYLRDVWPDTKLLYFFEYFYQTTGGDIGFDPEFPSSFDDIFFTRTINAHHLVSLHVADWGITPTNWQYSTIPKEYQSKISVIFDGVDTIALIPDAHAKVRISDHVALSAKDEVITFISRNLEPYRGYHVFMRALPRLLSERPNAHVLIVGGDGVSYGRKTKNGPSYKKLYFDEVKIRLDLSRVHFMGRIPYGLYKQVLQISSAHVYLTYPFVLSWSLIEAMSTGCAIVASATPPVEEVISDGENGLLFDFFSTDQLVSRVISILDDQETAAAIRANARKIAIERYDLRLVCLPRQLDVVGTLAAGKLPLSP